MKLAIICDTHLPEKESAPQYHFLKHAVQQIKNDGIDTILSLGDISACGEWDAYQNYISIIDGLKYYTLIGNSDVRNPDTAKLWTSTATSVRLSLPGRTLLGINNPYGKISPEDRDQIETLHDGDILAMHHGLRALDSDSRTFLTELSQKRHLTILNGHHHRFQDDHTGKFRMISFRALDPDKAIGNFPTVTYLDITQDSILLEEKYISVSSDTIQNISKFFGISCVDNHRDVTYAAANNLYGIELRCNGGNWTPDMTLVPLLNNWRTHTNGYLSIHMPNVRWKNGEIDGQTQWMQAANYALDVGANGLTIHPPRVTRKDMFPGSSAWNAFLNLYVQTISKMSTSMHIGIENLHLSPGEPDNETAKFGCTPQEVCAWIDAINAALNNRIQVGHVLDVGHARNNGAIAQKYPISRWYEIMGSRIEAYHIHQVVQGENEMHNHQPIENWYGPMISYVSFFHCWETGTLNHKPVFLEVQGSENYQKSIYAFNQNF